MGGGGGAAASSRGPARELAFTTAHSAAATTRCLVDALTTLGIAHAAAEGTVLPVNASAGGDGSGGKAARRGDGGGSGASDGGSGLGRRVAAAASASAVVYCEAVTGDGRPPQQLRVEVAGVPHRRLARVTFQRRRGGAPPPPPRQHQWG